MADKANFYFIAIIPPEKIGEEITAFKKDFADRFFSKEALKVIPHITLKAPFKLPEQGHTKLIQWFRRLFVPTGIFPIELKDFGAFHNKYSPVVYVHPVGSVALYSLQKEIIRSFKNNWPAQKILDPEQKFMPHITIAYRDLQPDQFTKAWQEYKRKNYAAVFRADSFHLMQHNGKMWNIIDSYLLQTSLDVNNNAGYI